MASAPIVHLHDVDRFARLAVNYLAGRSASEFRQDLMAQHAIAYCLLSLSNAVARIDTENPGFLRDQLRADIAWQYFITQSSVYSDSLPNSKNIAPYSFLN